MWWKATVKCVTNFSLSLEIAHKILNTLLSIFITYYISETKEEWFSQDWKNKFA